jgi:hypothetical protein
MAFPHNGISFSHTQNTNARYNMNGSEKDYAKSRMPVTKELT